MKEERGVLVIGSSPMANVSPIATGSGSQPPFPTPSPFSFSVASTRWSSRPSIHYSSLVLRFLALIFSFASAVSLATASAKKDQQTSSLTEYPELMYCITVATLTFIYSAFQLFKGVCDISHRGILISDMASDYSSFILDLLAGYLLISTSSVAITVIGRTGENAQLQTATIISTSMSIVTFLVIGTCTILSGYKLCKRISW